MSENLHNASAARLRSFVGRIERLDEEIVTLNEDKAAIFKEAKGEGFDLPALRTLISDRRKMAKDPAKHAEQRDILAMYEAAMGTGTVRATRAPAQASTPHDAETGEIVEPVTAIVATTERPAPYRIVRDAPKPPVEDLDLPAGLRREPVVRSAAE